MHWSFMLPLVILGVVVVSGGDADEAADNKQAGWPGLFPQVQGYELKLQKPVVASVNPPAKPPAYRQTGRYDWLGGRLEALEITLARDDKFVKAYDPESLRQGNNPPQALKVGKYPAWQWKSEKLVVILAPDRIVMVESKTPEHYDSDLPGFARKMDLEKCSQALDQPPRAEVK